MLKRINIFEALPQMKKPNPWSKLIGAGVVLVVIAANVLSIGYVLTVSTANALQINGIKDFFNKPEVIEKQQQLEQLAYDIKTTQKKIELTNQLIEEVENQNGFATIHYQTIDSVRLKDVRLISLTFIDTKLTISALTRNDKSPADYTKALDDLNYFQKVEYAGFKTDNDGNILFSIICTLKGGTK
jgi:Tfp pilus assembly protein PilN